MLVSCRLFGRLLAPAARSVLKERLRVISAVAELFGPRPLVSG
jgi:hypothetical protein